MLKALEFKPYSLVKAKLDQVKNLEVFFQDKKSQTKEI